MEGAACARSVPELMRLREKIGARGKLADAVVAAIRAAGGETELPALPQSLVEVLGNPLRYYYFRAFLAAYQSLTQAELVEAVLQFRKITNPSRRLLRCVPTRCAGGWEWEVGRAGWGAGGWVRADGAGRGAERRLL
jgi:hypothetical protein